MAWQITQVPKTLPKLKKVVFIGGLPGIGNVGKVAVDFIKEELKAKKLFDVFSYTFPHSVFVNEKNLVELPTIEVYYKAFEEKNKSDLLLLVGDVQPIDEQSSYEFTEEMLNIVERFHGKEIITTGGIGLQSVPKKPKVYCTGNDPDMIKRYCKGTKLNSSLYGVVGPIVGVSGLLLGMSARRKIPAIAMLAETFGHPMYLGIKGAREIIKVMDKKLGLGIKLNRLDKEIEEIESEMIRRSDDFTKVSRQSMIKKLQGRLGKDMNYIG